MREPYNAINDVYIEKEVATANWAEAKRNEAIRREKEQRAARRRYEMQRFKKDLWFVFKIAAPIISVIALAWYYTDMFDKLFK